MKRSSGHVRNIQKNKRSKALKEFEKGHVKAYGQIPKKRDYDMFTRGFNMGFKSNKEDAPKGRLGIYSLNEVLDKVMCGECRVNFNSHIINMNRDNLKLFFRNHTCISCGIEGQYFVMEQDEGSNPHFNLYALKDGKEVLMTKDHVIPKSKGGKDLMSNYQVMCLQCNQEKGNKLE